MQTHAEYNRQGNGRTGLLMSRNVTVKLKNVIMTFLGMMIRLLFILIVLYYIYQWSLKAYDFGYRIFTEEPVSSGVGVDVDVTIPEGSGAMDIGEILEDRGLIQDRWLFFWQERLSQYHGKIQPGTYELSTAMTAEEMMAAMVPQNSDDESE